MPLPRAKKSSVSVGNKVLRPSSSENQEDGLQVKRSSSPPHGAPKKRTAFIDLTNAAGQCLSEQRPASDGGRTAHKVQISFPGRKKDATKGAAKKGNPVKKHAGAKKSVPPVSSEGTKEEEPSAEDGRGDVAAPVKELEAAAAPTAPPAVREEEPPAHLKKQCIPPEFDIDSENSDDLFMCPEYAKDIFDYLKLREEKFILGNYMTSQPSLKPEMRSILIDWLVEVQENFELYHETLYLAVKVTDHFLAQTPVQREMLQLVGSTAMLLASKFEERSPPCVDDFLYICDDAYKREELISMEAAILQALNFDINIPIPYRFLRRYAKCVNAGMDTLTLARFFLEMSLMEMDLVAERGSLLACACLLVALLTKELGGWSPILQYHSGYQASDLAPVVRKLHAMLAAPPEENLKAVRSKYSHKVFFEVATLPLVALEVLDAALQ